MTIKPEQIKNLADAMGCAVDVIMDGRKIDHVRLIKEMRIINAGRTDIIHGEMFEPQKNKSQALEVLRWLVSREDVELVSMFQANLPGGTTTVIHVDGGSTEVEERHPSMCQAITLAAIDFLTTE